jgi:DNA-binding GntR family transcriptional regulator
MPEASNSSASPLQIEIANQIVEKIKEGSFPPGHHLTEQALAQEFGVSRSPIRAALKLLEDRGYLQSRANAGVFVSRKAPRIRLNSLVGDTLTADDLYRAIISDRANSRLTDTLSEAELLSRYEASRSVLTRTLLRMTREGLVERRKGHGWSFLPTLDSTEAKQESYRFRMLIECGGLREPTFAINADELAKSRRDHESFLKLAAAAQTPVAFFEMNANFHEMLAHFSGNRFIYQSVRQQNQLRRFSEYAHYVHDPVNLTESCNDHLQIIETLHSGDIDWAAQLLHRHLLLASKF